MSVLEAVVLGVVQGATEFIPISSTAHLRIIPALLGWNDPGAAFTAVTQWGTLIAALVYFRNEVGHILSGFLGLRRAEPLHGPDARPGWQIIVATLPVVIFGYLLRKYIKEDFRSLYVIAGSMAGLAVVLLYAEWRYGKQDKSALTSHLDKVTWTQALAVGFAQALALVPGASRSGVTITASLLVSFDRPTAARFSFLLSLPAVFGAGLFELIKDRKELLATSDSAGTLLLATVVAGVVGYASIEFLMRLLKKSSMASFIVYRIALGAAIVWMLQAGVLKDAP